MDKRLDVLVSEKLSVSREYAKEIILAGKCKIGDKTLAKPGMKIPENLNLSIDANPLQFVSRGGLKLAKALEVFDITLQSALCLDVGASTGGFTDCMLQSGAKSVIALENGTNQLHPSLRDDPRVISMENTEIRAIKPNEIAFLPQFIAVDISFISLSLVIPKITELLHESGKVVFLIKPQFEVGKGGVSKRGVVREPKVHMEIINKLCSDLQKAGLMPSGLDFSPITGQNGNREYLLLAIKSKIATTTINVEKVVKAAFVEL